MHAVDKVYTPGRARCDLAHNAHAAGCTEWRRERGRRPLQGAQVPTLHLFCIKSNKKRRGDLN